MMWHKLNLIQVFFNIFQQINNIYNLRLQIKLSNKVKKFINKYERVGT